MKVAALQEPFGNAVFVTMNQDISGLSVAILGCGPIGLFTIGIARAVGATPRKVDELSLEQALTLLGRWTGTDFDQLPPVADRLCLHVGNLALGVALVGGMIKGRGARRSDWLDVVALLEGADVDAIKPVIHRHCLSIAHKRA